MPTPVDSLEFYIDDAGNLCALEVGSRQTFVTGSLQAPVGEAPTDGNTYARQDAGWVASIPAQQLIVTGLQPGNGTESATVPLDVQGTGFTATSVINWAGYPLATTFVSATELQAQLNLGPGSAGNYTIVVTDGAQQSNSVAFVVNPAATVFASANVSLTVNADGDLVFTQAVGPNAGKSVNLTYGKWT